MKRALIVLLGVVLAVPAPGNVPVDSMALESTLERLDPEARVDLLLDRAEDVRRNDPRAAIDLATQARIEADLLNDRESLARADITIGVGHLYLGAYREAMEAFRGALAMSEVDADSVIIADALNNIGIVYFYWGEHDTAVNYYIRALRIREHLGDREGMAKGYNNLAAVLQTAGEYDQALDYFQQSLAMYEEVGSIGLQAASLNNIGLLHYDRGEYDLAMAAYEKALEYGRQIGDNQHAALTLNNMGMVLEARDDLEGALARYHESLAIREELGDRQGALVCRHNIGVIQSSQGMHGAALANLEGALNEARAIEVLELERDNLESLALALQEAGQDERALSVFKEYKAADDTLRAQERSRQIFSVQTRFEVDLKDREIEVLRKDKEIERSRRNALAGGAVLSVLIIVLLFQRYLFQKRAADEIRRTNTALRQAHDKLERAARDELAHVSRVVTLGELAAAFAHELNQPLAAILANARAGRNYLAKPEADTGEVDGALEDIGDDAGRAQEIIINLRRLMRKGEMRRESVAVAGMVTDALKIIRPDCTRQGVTVEFDAEAGLPSVIGDRIQLQQVVINLIQNASTVIATADVPVPGLLVRAARIDGDLVEVAVVDQGPPVTDEVLGDMFEPFFTTRPRGLGMGLAICRTIIEAHGGTLTAWRNDGPGLTVAFRLPATGS